MKLPKWGLLIASIAITSMSIPNNLSAQQITPSNGKRHPTIITFDPPGSVATFSSAINPAGAIAGFYLDASSVLHGFLRAPDGTFTEFEAPGAGTGPRQGTLAFSINPSGAITGF